MRPLRWLASAFINTFGITQPTPENENRMAVFIGMLLVAVVVGVAAVALLLKSNFLT